ncbi:unnamed protein product [Cuscuta campestris]|uniref:Uncharacterized protein n=1 Tax=Cuscuta campestris TaxID=132261 RepID=A0A484LIU0_9ASTE|nr:unnamed protein product [Cuscuta campestris]
MNDADNLQQATARYQDDGLQGKVPVDLWRILSRSPNGNNSTTPEARSSKKRFSATKVEADDTIGLSEQMSPFNLDDSDDEDPIPRPIGRKKAKSIASGFVGSDSISFHDDIDQAMV